MENTLTLAPDQIYSTAQAATMLEIGEGTIRSRKSRDKDKLFEGTHWLTQDGSTFWTCAGVVELARGSQSAAAQALLEKAGALVPTTVATTTVADSAALPVAPPAPPSTVDEATDIPFDLSFLEPLLDATGKSIALEFYRRLPNYVLKHVQRMAKNPTPQEREVIQAAFQPIQRMQEEVSDRCAS